LPLSLTPARRRGFEYLDEPTTSDETVSRSLRDVALANRLFGGARALLHELAPTFHALAARGTSATLLDVGTGRGDLPPLARAAAARVGLRLTTIGLDASTPLARESRARIGLSVQGDGLALPFRSRSVDVVICSQVLHHFEGEAMLTLLREMHRVARVRVVVSDLRRSYVAAAGFWLATWPLRFHPISRHDGVVSVLRGFTPRDLRLAVRDAVGVEPVATRRLGWRVTTSWSPDDAATTA
jgi:SAM-dependent methyltransferase